jgi:hypothetical protein
MTALSARFAFVLRSLDDSSLMYTCPADAGVVCVGVWGVFVCVCDCVCICVLICVCVLVGVFFACDVH